MNIFDVSSINDGYIALDYIAVSSKNELWPQFTGRSLSGDLADVILKFVGDEKGSVGDFAYLTPGILCCSESAKNKLDDISSSVEWIKFTIDGVQGHWYFINVTDVKDCLDREKSEIDYLDDEETEIFDVEEYVFKDIESIDSYIFKVKGIEATQIFCTDKFVELIEDSSITCVTFKKV